MTIANNQPLSSYTAFNVGGLAKTLITINQAGEIEQIAQQGYLNGDFWVLGYGTNCVISDQGLDGAVILMRDGPQPVLEQNLLVIDAATDWDKAVQFACNNQLWGIELMSGIPGNTGAALSGNIAAYGQAISDTFAWAEVFDPTTKEFKKLDSSAIKLSYRASNLQTELKDLIITKLALQLSNQPTMQLEYASALRVAEQLGLDQNSLENRRKIILETRLQAGSIYNPQDENSEKTAGSFFKNPVLDEAKALEIIKFEESDRSPQEVLEQNRIHGGDEFRISAALVLLAAGFNRGQSWGNIKLHDKHVLKIQNSGQGTAQEIYSVASEIIATVKQKLDITLEPEVKFLGKF